MDEPLLISAMRRDFPDSHVRTDRCGTTVGGFLREFDEYVAACVAAERERIITAVNSLPEHYSDGWEVKAYEIKASIINIVSNND